MSKKFLSIILAFAIICNYAVMADPKPSNEQYEISKSVLTDLNLWKDFNPNENYITRAAAAAYMCMFINKYDSLTAKQPDIYQFKDIKYDHWAKPYFIYLNSVIDLFASRIVQGDETGNFRPDDYCTYGEFIKMLISTLNWGGYSLYNGEYPKGYFVTADKLGIYHQNKENADDYITKSDSVLILFNAARVLAFHKTDDPLKYKLEEAITYLNYYWNIFEVRGYAKKELDGSFKIGDKLYNNCLKDESFSEGNVLLYYKNDKDNLPYVIAGYQISSLDFDNPKGMSEDLIQFYNDYIKDYRVLLPWE